MVGNLAAKLRSLLSEEAIAAERWKLLGQERDGSLLVTWQEQKSLESDISSCSTVIGYYDRINDQLRTLHRFPNMLNVIQATISQNRSLMGYISKQKSQPSAEFLDNKQDSRVTDLGSDMEIYRAHIVEIDTAKVHNLNVERSKQIRIQFLYKKKIQNFMSERFLLLVHRECAMVYTVTLDNIIADTIQVKELKSEELAKEFVWAQWDAVNQVLYHIHHRRALVSLVTEDDDRSQNRSSPTLSGLQFHDDLPHETVLNIPLNLPHLSTSANCGTYEDDVIPLRVHDCSLDLIVVSDPKGMVCVCHHYLYRPVKPPQHILNSLDESNTVHFAYSVTLLHHSCVIHCVIPGIPWSRAKLMRPIFAIYENHRMIVFVHGLFTHLLEIGLNHEPCCHILCGPSMSTPSSRSFYLVPLLVLRSSEEGKHKKHEACAPTYNSMDSKTAHFEGRVLTIDLPTLDLIELTISSEFLIDIFHKESSIEIRLGILHYFLCHKIDMEIVAKLVAFIAEKPRLLDIVRCMQEILIGGSYTLVQKNLLADTLPLLCLLPVTTMDDYMTYEAKVHDFNVTLSHEKLWNTSVMLLSPQQRLIPYHSDLWTRLWDQLNTKNKTRFNPRRIAEKLLVSLACYQPEALSRCSTPMSPNGGLVIATVALGDSLAGRPGKSFDGSLPFTESESCTASKQEHIVSVNLRELSMYLLKYGTLQMSTSCNVSQNSCTALHVHAMATRYVAAQLETSRILCQMLCRAANVDLRSEQERGFVLIDQLDATRRRLLFLLLERYRYAIENIAFPAPQGFTSFFTYLGYRCLSYSMFLQYVQRAVFELQVDVGKVIMSDIDDTKEGVLTKLTLLSLLPRSRAKRLLNQWSHPVSFMLRAREHATNILSGETSQNRGRTSQHRNHHNGLAAFPSADRLSPLDTFLDLLTAKASLAELDFGLLIEATVCSTDDFL